MSTAVTTPQAIRSTSIVPMDTSRTREVGTGAPADGGPDRAGPFGSIWRNYSTNGRTRLSNGMALIGKLDTPEISCGIVDFDAQFEGPMIFRAPRTNDTKFPLFVR